MPTFIKPKYVHVETGGGGGALIGAAVVVVTAGAGVIWLARELARYWVDVVIIGGGTLAFVVAFGTACAVQSRRGHLRVNQAAKAGAIAQARAALPAGETHFHTHYEEHHHLHQAPAAEQHVHVHQAPAAECRPAIAARKVIPGVVLGAAAPKAIEARKAPLYRINASEPAAIEKRTT